MNNTNDHKNEEGETIFYLKWAIIEPNRKCLENN